MAKVWVKELTGGLDVRRLSETTPGGVLIKGENGHITSGGEFETRAAFVKTYTLPANTIGLAADATGLIVFGSPAAPTMPSGVSYQRLQKGAKSLDSVPSWDLYGGDVYAVAVYTDGTIVHFFDTAEVTDWFDGRARASLVVTGGEDAVSTIQILVDGVDVTGGAVTYDTDPVTTAAAIAAAINGHTSSPDYDATASGTQVNIIAATAGSASNGLAVTFVYDSFTSDFAVTPSGGLFMANGADSSAFTPGTFVKTAGRRMMALSGSVWHISGTDTPTHWTTEYTGAAFFDQAKETSNGADLQAIANYQGFVALVAKKAILIWVFDPDPDNIQIRQKLENTGTVSPRSVTEYGDADVFYEALSGLRSMRARDSTNNATTTDLGSPIDKLVKAKLQALSATERSGVIGLINPVDDRFWLCFPDGEIYVFSFFPSAKVSAWTTYIFTNEDGDQAPIDEVVVFGDRVNIRSGDAIYTYGGLDTGGGLTYDSTVGKAWLPFFDAGQPTEKKQWRGIDAAVEGTWAVYVGTVLNDISVRENVSTITETTFDADRIPYEHQSTHASIQFESSGVGPHVLSSCVLHYDGSDEDE